jgi:arylsulfatase A-like enzyme
LNTPSGNIDLAPTILRILNISHEGRMDGRVLEEAFIDGPEEPDVDWSRDLYSTERRLTKKMFRQQIRLSRVGDTVYVDEGNSTLGWR